ncbi:cytochrome P450 family protein [Amycolatopsis regifaucium]|uniref:Cytochrome n=1 Tax=Amycolatopsis regifaucium TaxID=546365 RepID=A0A154M461_9PSEU|nr:cytochrome P450 [Amycolatopsis regifaucium]KZB79388.1 cytochrome [Amycolatopsis regifaucium]OKA07570.1 cytochrome [Amycolatopsis regifaucium]SFH08073.1 Cytochrome P450 [Amycolatopsis regifaucium]
MSDVPEISLTDPQVLHDPFTAYSPARERSPVAKLVAPGLAMWAVLRHEEARKMLSDPRFALSPNSYQRMDIPDHCRPYMRTMQEAEGAEHLRLRRLVSPAFTPRKAAALRPGMERLVNELLDGFAGESQVDLITAFARPLPMDVICALVGIPEADRPRWREYGATVAAGDGAGLAKAVPGIVEDSLAAIAHRKLEPAEDVVSQLLQIQADDGDRLSETELVALVWQLVLGGQVPGNLIANSVETLFAHPAQLAELREDPALMPGAVEELMRWCSPQLLTIPRFTTEHVRIGDVLIPEGEPVTVAIPAVNRDPRTFPDPEVFDIRRAAGPAWHLAFAHGPHFCLGASLARAQTEVALTALLRRFPDLALTDGLRRIPDPGTWRLDALPASLRAPVAG